MRIPPKLQIPVTVFALLAALVAGLLLVFIVLLPD